MLAQADSASSLSKHWWIFLVRGIIAIIFGIVIVSNPGVALAFFIILFAAYAFADGVLALIAAFRTSENRGWLIVEGIAGVGLGLLAFFHPIGTLFTLAAFLAIMIAAWALVTGIIEVVMAIRMRNQMKNTWVLLIVGVLSIILGLYLFANPALALVAWVWYVAFYAFLAGVGFIAFGFALRSSQGKLPAAAV